MDPSAPLRARRVSGKVRLLAVAAAVGGPGLWAFLAPASFYDKVATYPPYNEHLFHDLGAFLAGLGVALAAAAWLRDALTLALVANASAAVLHAIAHIADRSQGGKASDPWLFTAVALLFVWSFVARLRRGRI